MARGTVKKVLVEKGYGFIEPVAGGADQFFHFSELKNLDFDESLIQREVEFDIGRGRNGRERAQNIRPLR